MSETNMSRHRDLNGTSTNKPLGSSMLLQVVVGIAVVLCGAYWVNGQVQHWTGKHIGQEANQFIATSIGKKPVAGMTAFGAVVRPNSDGSFTLHGTLDNAAQCISFVTGYALDYERKAEITATSVTLNGMVVKSKAGMVDVASVHSVCSSAPQFVFDIYAPAEIDATSKLFANTKASE